MNDYKGRLANFLNDYMEVNKKINENEITVKKDKFECSVNLIFDRMMNKQPFPKINKTTIEGILVGVMQNINEIEVLSDDRLKAMYRDLRQNELYSIESLKGGLANKEKVQNRLNKAIEIFNPLTETE